jgi:hypothetical protein
MAKLGLTTGARAKVVRMVETGVPIENLIAVLGHARIEARLVGAEQVADEHIVKGKQWLARQIAEEVRLATIIQVDEWHTVTPLDLEESDAGAGDADADEHGDGPVAAADPQG